MNIIQIWVLSIIESSRIKCYLKIERRIKSIYGLNMGRKPEFSKSKNLVGMKLDIERITLTIGIN